MISSAQKAPKFGSGRLVVDGTDNTVVRTAEFSLSPRVGQANKLNRLVAICAETYNAGVEHRRQAWRRAGTSVSLFDQFGEIKDLKGVRDDALAFGIQPLRGALRRVDHAYARFFARVKGGQTPGYPRFKSAPALQDGVVGRARLLAAGPGSGPAVPPRRGPAPVEQRCDPPADPAGPAGRPAPHPD